MRHNLLNYYFCGVSTRFRKLRFPCYWHCILKKLPFITFEVYALGWPFAWCEWSIEKSNNFRDFLIQRSLGAMHFWVVNGAVTIEASFELLWLNYRYWDCLIVTSMIKYLKKTKIARENVRTSLSFPPFFVLLIPVSVSTALLKAFPPL